MILLAGDACETWREVAADLEAALRAEIACAGIPVAADPAIGICDFTLREVGPRDVLRRLFNAADDARDAGRSCATYDERRDHAHSRSFRLLSDIRSALERTGELALVYQPRVDLRSGACVGAEALLRWRHPTLGQVPPGEFIPLAEQTALAKPITDWVLEAAIDQVARWRRVGPAPRVSINASALNLEEPDFASRLMRTLERHRVTPDAIELEFTESALARDGSRVLEQLDELRRTGIEIAIDDFGTGYSSLSYLQRLPASILKIDRSFVRPLGSSSRDQRLVQAMIGMAHDLGYRVVAEGIETQDVYELLLAWRCDEAQGYHISHPLPPSCLEAWLGRSATGATSAIVAA